MHIRKSIVLYLALPCLACLSSTVAQEVPDRLNVKDYGAHGDGQTDDTGPFQRALDAAHAAGGGTVFVPRGNYFFAGHLTIPDAVTLQGVWPTMPGCRASLWLLEPRFTATHPLRPAIPRPMNHYAGRR